MPEKRTVKVNGEEFEVEIELNDDGTYEATVEGKLSPSKFPMRKQHLVHVVEEVERRRNLEPFLQIFQVKSSPSKSTKEMLSKRASHSHP